MSVPQHLHVSEGSTGFSIFRRYLSSLRYCGGTFPTGLDYDEPVEFVVLPFPKWDGLPHILAFREDSTRINLVLLHQRDGSGVTVSTLSYNNKVFASDCNGFVSHAGEPCLSATNPANNDRYVTAVSDATPPYLRIKLVSSDAMLRYITKRATFEELDAAAAAERKVRDQLAELQEQNELLKERLAIAGRANRELRETSRQLRIQNAAAHGSVARQDEALKLVLTWCAILFTDGLVRWLAERKSPVQTRSLLRAIKAERMGGSVTSTPFSLATNICNLKQRGNRIL